MLFNSSILVILAIIAFIAHAETTETFQQNCYIDNTFASSPKSGTRENPFNNIEDCFDFLKNPTEQDPRHLSVYLAPTEQFYGFTQRKWTFNDSVVKDFSISAWENSGLCLNKQQDCSHRPNLDFGNTHLNAENISSFTMKSLIVKIYDNNLEIINATVTLGSLSFPFKNRARVITLTECQKVTISDISVQITLNATWLAYSSKSQQITPDVLVENVVANLDINSEVKDRVTNVDPFLMAFSRVAGSSATRTSGKITIRNTSISSNQTKGPRLNLKSFLTVRGFSRVYFQDFSIKNMTFSTFTVGFLATFEYIDQLQMSGLEFSGNNIVVNGSYPLFRLKNIASLTVSDFAFTSNYLKIPVEVILELMDLAQLTSFTFKNHTVSNNVITSGNVQLFKLRDNTDAEKKPTKASPKFSDIKILNNRDSSSLYQFSYFVLQGPYIGSFELNSAVYSNNSLSGRIFQLQPLSDTSSLTSLRNPISISIKDAIISDNLQTVDTSFFYFFPIENGLNPIECLSVIDPYVVNFENLTFTNNVFTRGYSILWVYEASFFQIQGARLILGNSLIANNFFGLYNFIKLTQKASSILFENIQVLDNAFNSSQFINTNYLKSPNACQRVNNEYTNALCRFSVIQSCNFSRISLNSSTFMTINNGFTMFEANNFDNIILDNSVLLATSFTAARLSFNSKGYIRDKNSEVVSFSGLQSYSAAQLFKDSNQKIAVFQTNNSYFYYMGSNNFTQINATSSSLININGFGFDKSFILIQRNLFQDLNFTLDSVKQVFNIDSFNEMAITRNAFDNIQGQTTLFHLPNSQISESAYIYRNQLNSSTIANFLYYGKMNMGRLDVTANEFFNNIFTQSCFTFNLRDIYGNWTFEKNYFYKNDLSPNSANKQAELYALFHIYTTEACSLSSIAFNDNFITNLTVFPYAHGESNSIAENYIFAIESPRPVAFNNLTLKYVYANTIKTSLMYISDSVKFVMNNSWLEGIKVRSDYGAINLLAKTIVISNSYFNQVFNVLDIGLFYIDPPSGNYSAQLHNNTFDSIGAGTLGAILVAKSLRNANSRNIEKAEIKNRFYLSLQIKNCTVSDSGFGHLFTLHNTSCVDCLFQDNSFHRFTKEAQGLDTFMRIQDSDGILQIKNSTFPLMRLSLPIVEMLNSQLDLHFINLDYDAQGNPFTLITMDHGSIYLLNSTIKNVFIEARPIIQVVATENIAVTGRFTNNTNVIINNTQILNITKSPITISGMKHIVELLSFKYDPEQAFSAKTRRIGGVIFIAKPLRLDIINSSFDNITNTPVAFFTESVGLNYNSKIKSYITFFNSTFKNLNFTMGPALTVIPNTYSPSINIYNCIFDTVEAQAGGAFSLYNSSAFVSNTNFSNYNAGLIAPIALIGGMTKGISFFQSSTFNGFKSPNIGDIDSEAVNFAISFVSNSTNPTIKRAQGLTGTEQTIMFEGATDHEFQAGFLQLDYLNTHGKLTPDFSIDAQITFSTSAAGSLSQNNFESTRKRLSTTSALIPLKGVILQGRAFDKITLVLSYNASRIVQNRTIIITLRPCIAGEHDNGICCEPCQYPTFTLDPQQVCNHCPAHAECPGQNKIRPSSGYWNANDSSLVILDCPDDGSTRCNPDIGGNGRCKIGYAGPLCYSCDYENGYTESGYFECSKCTEPFKELIISSILAVLYFIFQFVAIYIIYAGINHGHEDSTLVDVNKVERAYYLKSALTYGQLMSILCLTSPQIYETFGLTSQIGNPSSLLIFGTQCSMHALKSLGVNYSQFLYYQTYAVIAIPVLHFVLFSLFALIFPIFKRSVSRKGLISVAVIYLALKYQPGNITSLVQFLSCQTTKGLGYSYIASHPFWQCGTPQYKFVARFLVAPSGLIWCILIPTIIILSLRSKRNDLQADRTKNFLGFLYVDAKHRYYYWGALVMVLKICLSLLVYGLEVHSDTQIFAFLILLWIYQSLVRSKKPFATEQCNNFEILLINLLLFNLVMIKCLLDSTQVPGITKTAITISIIVNLSFVAYIIWKILKLSAKNKMGLIDDRSIQDSMLSESLVSKNASQISFD